MRAGLSTIQQTLTPEAATVLTHSIAEAARRNHGQTTPLHVAATLLSSPSGLLRQACIKSHPNSSHPLQCRALELCFSVALDRLPSNPTTNTSDNSDHDSNKKDLEPPISNALMAALKRAQAHQRRGCPEQQQSPLLAVKVELEQLVVSILDDPSVSRVMKEASFSSPAVKATIEQSLAANSPSSSSSNTNNASAVGVGVGLGLGSRLQQPQLQLQQQSRNLYMNPRLNQHHQQLQKAESDGGKDEVKKVMEILSRSCKKRNPILVGDSDLSSLVREVIDRVEKGELGSKRTAIRVGSVERIKELGALIERSEEGVVLDLGDLKWLVESNGGVGRVSETGKEAAAELGRILAAAGGKVLAVGTATCATYMRCRIYHPTLEAEWDLEAVPIAPRAPNRGLFPRLGIGNGNGILSSSVEALAPPKGFPAIKPMPSLLRRPTEAAAENSQQQKQQTLCPQCTESYERELAKLVAKEFDKSSSDSWVEPRSAVLPQWLQMATPSSKPPSDQFQSKEQEHNWRQSMEELLKRWRQTCSRLHSNAFGLLRSFQPKSSLAMPIGFPPLQLANTSERPPSPPTDLVLGRPKPQTKANPTLEISHRDRIKEFPGCKQDHFSTQRTKTVTTFEDSDSLKRLFKGLMEKVSWQTEAASAVTAAVLEAKSGNGKRRGLIPKADTWLLFIGPDKVGKRKMASALSELVFGVEPITIHFGNSNDGESNLSFRGRTVLDRVADSLKQNPFSVIMLEDIDQADAVVRGTIKRAIERGRLSDSYGREVSLGSAIFVLTANWLPDELKNSRDSVDTEEKILSYASSSWQLELSVGSKRLPDWLKKDDNHHTKRKKEISLDLNLAAGGNVDDEAGEGSWNSSDLTVEHESEHGRLAIKQHSASSTAAEFVECVDNSVVFKPVDFQPLRRRISEIVSAKFTAMIGTGRSIKVDDSVLDRIVGGVWLSGIAVEEWAERVLVPSIEQIKRSSIIDEGSAVRLLAVETIGRPPMAGGGDWLPSTVRVAGM